MWKYIVLSALLISLGTLGFVAYQSNKKLQEVGIETGITISPFSKLASNQDKPETLAEQYPLGNPINILLLGIDRRSKFEYSYRTDIMIMVSINPATNNVVMTSIPRDLWYNGNKINGLFLNSGWEVMKTAMGEVTGLAPERYVLTDFEDFAWVVNAMGGVPVEVDNTFTDSSYPIDETQEYQTVSFTAGPEQLTGDRALIYARSRKGTNGEGSDWARMRRQHKILSGMLKAVLQPRSIFNPMVIENAFKTVTQGRMDTNLKLEDAAYLWDFYQDKDLYTTHSLFLDYEYLYSPPPENYGGAWTIVPRDGTYETFRTVVQNRLQGIVIDGTLDSILVSEANQNVTDL